MSNKNAIPDRERRSLVAELERRRSKIERAKSSFEVLIGSYDLVLADLGAVARGKSGPATGDETSAA